LFGPISEKVSAGNDSGIHSRYKHIGKDKHMFVYLLSSKTIAPSEPTTKKNWDPHLQASKERVKKNSVIFSNVASFKDHALSKTLRHIDFKIAKLRKLTNPATAPRPVTPTAAAPPSSDASIPSTSYWGTSANAIKLFQPRPEESVSVCLQHRINLLTKSRTIGVGSKKWWKESSL
jgi:hypothetical protein